MGLGLGQCVKNKLIIILLALNALSCALDVSPREAELGKESTNGDLQKAIDDALSGISIADAKINQYVTYEDNVRVELGEVMRSRLISHKLTDIKEDEQNINFVFFEDLWRFDLASGDIVDEKHSELVVPFQKAPRVNISTNSIFAKNLTSEACDGHDVKDQDGLVYDCIKYFNLTSERRRVPPPAAVAAKPNCMDLPDCLINIHYLQYDQVKWRNGKSVSTLTITAEIAKEVPDLMYEKLPNGTIYSTPPVNSLCYKGSQKIENRSYLVSQCTVLRDFE